MANTPQNPGAGYVLDWETFADCKVPTIWPAGWNANDLPPQWSHPNNEPPFRIACVPEPVRSGWRSARFQLNKGDTPVSGGARAELKNPPPEPLNAERWYGFCIYLPLDYYVDQSAEALTQWHQADTQEPKFQGSPPLAILTKGENWVISVRKASWDNTKDPNTSEISAGKFEKGKWTSWVVHVRWSEHPTRGLLEIWKDGANVHSAQGQNKFNDGQGNYMKFGIYKWDWSQNKPSGTTQRVMYYDELRIADQQGSYNAVVPRQTTQALNIGDHITLECLGHIPGNRFLDGRTANGTVGLAPNTGGGFTGTRWRVGDGGGGAATFECLGHIPGNRFLDGRTANGTVGLAPNTGGGFTGTRWRVMR